MDMRVFCVSSLDGVCTASPELSSHPEALHCLRGGDVWLPALTGDSSGVETVCVHHHLPQSGGAVSAGGLKSDVL